MLMPVKQNSFTHLSVLLVLTDRGILASSTVPVECCAIIIVLPMANAGSADCRSCQDLWYPLRVLVPIFVHIEKYLIFVVRSI
jgi:hypothetical protein